MDGLVPVTRPNGKIYRPRKPPRWIHVEDPTAYDDPGAWVYVLGTHDVERAWRLVRHVPHIQHSTATRTWIRHTMRDNEHCYDSDTIRGAAAVTFEVWE